ncbi:MAG: hypothetical protein HOH04_14675 [Rhodospirillaceae bacterium]|jgi:hypothetical protein|nr:hypothetical protein [Rhodospirillaceae bacterium]
MKSSAWRILCSTDTVLAIIGTLFAVFSVILNQQWAGERHSQAGVMAEERAKLLNEVVLVADTRREAVRLRDLNTLYTALEGLATDEAGRTHLSEEALRAYEIALVSMLKHDAGADFDEVAFKFEALATEARGGDGPARLKIAREFVRLLGVVNKKHTRLRAREQAIDRELAGLRRKAAELTTIAVYLQVFGLILVMLATIIGLKRIEFAVDA